MDRLDLKARAPNSCLANTVLLDLLLVEAGVEAVDWDNFLELDRLLLGGPVQDRIVVNAEVVAHPKNDSVHLVFVQI